MVGASRVSLGAGAAAGAACFGGTPASSLAIRASTSLSLLRAVQARMSAAIAMPINRISNMYSPKANRTSTARSSVDCSRNKLPAAHPKSGRRPLLQHTAAETKQRGGPSAGLCGHIAGRFDQRAGFHQPAEILLVQVTPRNRFDGSLQVSKCELAGQKFKYHRAVFQFCAQPRDRGRKNAPVIEPHRLAERGQLPARERSGPAVAPRLFHQPRFIEQLVAVEHALLVPAAVLATEIEPHPFAPAERARQARRLGLLRPLAQRRHDLRVEDL